MNRYETIKVNKGWIDKNIVKPGWQRNLYIARVNHFINHIRNKTFEKSLITVAKDNQGKSVLLDGQHKIEAISRAGVDIEMDFCIHDSLDEDDMIKIYRMLNNVKQPRLIDDIKIHISKTEWLDKYMEDFPINISLGGGINSMRIDNFLNIIHNGRIKEMRRRNLNRKVIDSFIETLDQTTYYLMSDFCNFYKTCFGEPTKENWLYRNTVMFTIFRMWNANRHIFDIETLTKAFKQIETKDSIRRDSMSVDILSLEAMTRKLYTIVNFKRTVNKFIIFWEEEFILEE